MSRAVFRAGLPALAALALAACDNGPTDPAGRDPADLAASVVLGDAQAGTVGRALADSVVVQVSTRGGSPLRGLELEWRVLSEGGEILRSTTTTGRDGRSANAWVLGTRAGEQLLEVRALLDGGPAVLDTVRASAAADVPAALRLVGDSVRTLGVGDTVRLAVQGTDRFGNPVPAAALRPQWASLDPTVAVADSTGLVRVVGAGDAAVEAVAGTARVRVVVRAGAATEEFPVTWSGHYPYVRRFYQGGGRMLAIGLENYRATTYSLTFGFSGAAWSNTGSTGALFTSAGDLYVAPDGTAYGTGTLDTYVSPPGGAWRPDSTLRGWQRVTGAGGAVFGLRSPLYSGRSSVERLAGGRLTDLALPEPYAGRQVNAFAAASETELYASTETETAYWNGTAWSLVPGTGLGFANLVSPSGGGAVWGVLGRSALYTLRGGRAERVSNPLEDRGEAVLSLAVDRDGQPYLLHPAGFFYRTAAGWREHRFAKTWDRVTAVWPADDGSVWVSAYRNTGEMTYYGLRHELVMLRVRVRAR
ncbi:MAG TPA: Ig-like domain-containing protein [Longimicrobiaceae bacterium]|jgi:hypothetical protein